MTPERERRRDIKKAVSTLVQEQASGIENAKTAAELAVLMRDPKLTPSDVGKYIREIMADSNPFVPIGLYDEGYFYITNEKETAMAAKILLRRAKVFAGHYSKMTGWQVRVMGGKS